MDLFRAVYLTREQEVQAMKQLKTTGMLVSIF